MMKKLMYLCLMVAVMPFISCSSDDDNNSEKNTIVGKWNYVAFESEDPINDCQKKSTAEFNDDGTYFYEFFSDDSGECASEGVKNGTWESTGNGTYKGTYDYPQNGGIIVDVTMEVNGNTLKIKYSYEYAGESYTDVWVYAKAE